MLGFRMRSGCDTTTPCAHDDIHLTLDSCSASRHPHNCLLKPFLAQAYTAPCTPAMQRSILGYTRAKNNRSFEVRQQQAQAKRDAEIKRLDLPWPNYQETWPPHQSVQVLGCCVRLGST
eukprot:5128519-Amphidinium_carterae.1